MKKTPIAERLARNVLRRDTGCLEWQGCKDSWGYGSIGVEGKTTKTHRLSYELTRGPIPKGLRVLHTCDTPACVEPKHLFLGTDADNAEDKAKKGRTQRLIGETNPMSKLSEGDVREILWSYNRGEGFYSLCGRFGVSEPLVRGIISKKIWAHIT